MIILPAIDLKDGRCVRLKKGDFDTAHCVADSAVNTAQAFQASGAQWIHMVDLDGARGGIRQNGSLVKAVADTVTAKIELGGGVRTMEELEAVFALGVSRAVIGSAAVTDPAFLRAAVEQHGERVAVGVDTLDGVVKTSGWEQSSGLDYLAFAAQLDELGVKTIIFTDIATDGMLSGPSFQRLADLQRRYSGNIIASGGVTTLDDIRRLRDMGLYGAIIGKAYYAGTVDLAQAIREAGEQGC